MAQEQVPPLFCTIVLQGQQDKEWSNHAIGSQSARKDDPTIPITVYLPIGILQCIQCHPSQVAEDPEKHDAKTKEHDQDQQYQWQPG